MIAHLLGTLPQEEQPEGVAQHHPLTPLHFMRSAPIHASLRHQNDATFSLMTLSIDSFFQSVMRLDHFDPVIPSEVDAGISRTHEVALSDPLSSSCFWIPRHEVSCSLNQHADTNLNSLTKP